ncbi:MAG: DUF551 domain-containing protein [Burkholderiaceae bacterium]|jgi:hypothetical protein|nr:DUF551 domain-containing protein [Burkholderiaceae bacterium]
MTQDQSRAEFEAWWIVQGKYCRAAGGDYEMYLASQAWQAARAAAPAPARWFPVSERLPEPFTDVIVWPRPTDYCCEAQVDKRGEWSYGVYEHYNGHVNYQAHVTHWMPLPQPPKEQG